ncbi:site-specific integrase [Oceanidesulfovibrio indonesiensis]|uniref:Site-specific integrase n=2 Tax=Oceanidesulfovibrio indonesiensis TaxID=54767 RepID=A0A7M3MAD3_9BACT|nr:site-specific integrase [Oceanidesulfovibrio indonesiensis]TVM13799.1 site-specific integrase [Oceanidesulfovibrio indonesiensis]
MPTLDKRSQPHWKGVVMVKGKRKEKHFPDASRQSKRDAIEWENQMREKLRDKSKAIPMDSCPNLLEWSTMYLNFCKESQSIKTYEEKRDVYRRFVKFAGPKTSTKEVGLPMVMRFLMKQKKERSGYAANKCRKNLATGWKWGRRYMDGFPDGPNVFLDADRMPEKRKPRYVPPEADFWKVCNLTEGQDKVMLLFALHTAARRGEIFRAKVDDLDFEQNTVLIGTSKREHGNMEYDLIPMTPTLRKVLIDWLEVRPIQSEFLFVNMSEHNYASDFYGEPFVVRQHFMRRLCAQAGVKPFSWHGIRHLTATILYQEGQTVSVIQRILRHKSPNTTARYLHRLGLDETRDALTSVMDGRGM